MDLVLVFVKHFARCGNYTVCVYVYARRKYLNVATAANGAVAMGTYPFWRFVSRGYTRPIWEPFRIWNNYSSRRVNFR